MKHAEKLIAKLLYLNGIPNITRHFEIKIGTTVQEMLNNDYALEKDAVQRLNKLIQLAHTHKDFGSEELFQEVLRHEEGHVD